MVSLSHSSYPSDLDENGFRQRLSIDPWNSQKDEVSGVIQYAAKAFSPDAWADDKHLMEMDVTFLDKSLSNRQSEEFAMSTVQLNSELRSYANKFNNITKKMIKTKDKSFLFDEGKPYIINFRPLNKAELESTCSLSKKRREGEFFVYGQKLSNKCTFRDSDPQSKTEQKKKGFFGKRQRSSNSYSEDTGVKYSSKKRARANSLKDEVDSSSQLHRQRRCNSVVTASQPHWILDAFVHHHFCSTGGKVAVGCLRGCHDNEDGYTLVMPTLHSVQAAYGLKDRGVTGIRQVIQSHQCNDYCQHLPPMANILENSYRHIYPSLAAEAEEGEGHDVDKSHPQFPGYPATEESVQYHQYDVANSHPQSQYRGYPATCTEESVQYHQHDVAKRHPQCQRYPATCTEESVQYHQHDVANSHPQCWRYPATCTEESVQYHQYDVAKRHPQCRGYPATEESVLNHQHRFYPSPTGASFPRKHPPSMHAFPSLTDIFPAMSLHDQTMSRRQ